jgi:mono/diheme cytochrome c family protein
MKRYFVGLALGAALLAPVVAQDTGNAENGKKLFMKNGCYECHGTVGQGGTGPRLAPRPLPPAALTAYVRKPGNGMPPYSSKVMSDAEAADIRAYLATIPEPRKDIPQLKP